MGSTVLKTSLGRAQQLQPRSLTTALFLKPRQSELSLRIAGGLFDLALVIETFIVMFGYARDCSCKGYLPMQVPTN